MKKLLVLLAAIAIITAGVGVASAVDTTVTLTPGNNQTTNCTGTKLDELRLSTKSVKLYCRGTVAATTTTKPPVTTTTAAPTTTTQPPSGGSCTSNPQGNLGPFNYAGITNANGSNTYISNQVWAPQPGTTSTVCGTSPGNWTLTTRTTQDQGGAVQSYPDVQQLFNNWDTSIEEFNENGCGSTCSVTPIASLKTLTSSFNITNPPTSQGNWWAAYDIWTSSGEKMIITTGSDFRLANNGATVDKADVVIGGQHWTEMHYGGPGGLVQMVLHGNPASGTVDLLAMFKYWQTTGDLGANASFDQLNYGWEICDTGGATLTFKVNGYTLTAT